MGVISNGTTLLDAGALDSGVPSGVMTHIKTLTASSSGTLSFVNGASSVVFDGTYKEYVFKFIDMHPSGDNVNFTFNLSVDSGSNYNVTKTTNFWEAYHKEDGTDQYLATADGRDLAQSTDFQQLNGAGVQDENDGCISGTLTIYDPANTTFVKHFMSVSACNAHPSHYAWHAFMSGYGNTTSAVNAIQFKMSSGNIDAGTIKMYGIK